MDPHSFRLEEAKAAYLTPEEQARLVLDKFGAKIGSAIIRDNDQIGSAGLRWKSGFIP